jgi:hypothetical protein
MITDNLNDAWSFENWQTPLGIESTKQITWEKRGLHFLDSIRPAFLALIERQKPLISLAT